MIKIRIVTIGKDKDPWVTGGIAHYRKLLSKYANTELCLLPDVKGASSLPAAELKKRQAPLFEKEMSRGTTIALTDRGRQYDSIAFSKFIERLQVEGSGALTFLIGGPYGLDDGLLSHADYCVSLSSLTFSHQLVRLILLEQLYRAFSLLSGSSYHK